MSNRLLRATIYAGALLAVQTRTETSSYLDNPLLGLSTTKDLNDGPLSNLVDNDFTSMVRTVSSTKNYRYFTIDLKTAVPVVSIYAVSCHFDFEDNPYAERYYKNEVYVGN